MKTAINTTALHLSRIPVLLPCRGEQIKEEGILVRWMGWLAFIMLFLAAPLNVPAASSPAADAAQAVAPTVRTVLEGYLTATGGREALAEVQSLILKGSLQEGGREMPVEVAFKAPGMILMTLGSQMRQGRSRKAVYWRQDGASVGEIKDEKFQGGLIDLALGATPFGILRIADLFSTAVVEKVSGGEKEFIGLRLNTQDKPKLLFDPASGLLARKNNLRFADYRAVGKLRLPHVIHLAERTTLKVDAITLNPKLDDAVFDMPQGGGTDSDSARGRGMGFQFETLKSPEGRLGIVRQPAPMTFPPSRLKSLPKWNAQSSRHAQVDLRSADLRQFDVLDREVDLLHADFDDRTQWPAQLPPAFQPARVMELGKDPGLGVRELHRQGITGKGIGIGIIDQTLLVDHTEYRDRLRLYEEIHNISGSPAAMHGPAVASIALGKSLGVAPEADLYYIAEWHADAGTGGFNFAPLAESIHRLLDVNKTLKRHNKIRVISISVGWSPKQKGYSETMAALDRAKKEGVFIVSTALAHTYDLQFNGLGRDAMADPNQVGSFMPGSWWQKGYWDGKVPVEPGKHLLVPMDARATASPTAPSEYVYYTSGGWSWSVPWIAGLYALSCQVKPDLTPELFWQEALKTGKTIRVRKDGQEKEFGTIVDAPALMARLRELK